MRALLFTVDYPPNKGGVSRYYAELVKASNGQIKVAGVDQGEPWPKGNSLTARLKQVLWAYCSCFELHEEVKILSGQPHLALGVILARRSFSIFIHGGEWGKYYIFNKFLIFIYNKASQIILNSNATKARWIPKKYFSKCIVLTPGLTDFFSNKQSILNAKKLDLKSFYLLCVSRLTPRKNIDKLILAIKSIRKNTKIDLYLDIIGDGKLYNKLSNSIRESPYIKIHNKLNDIELLNYYFNADIFILTPSETKGDESWEGYGIVFLEAASMGLPIICSDSGGVSEATIPEGRIMISSSPSSEEIQQAILDLIADGKKLSAMSTKNISWSKKNIWSLKTNLIKSIIS